MYNTCANTANSCRCIHKSCKRKYNTGERLCNMLLEYVTVTCRCIVHRIAYIVPLEACHIMYMCSCNVSSIFNTHKCI